MLSHSTASHPGRGMKSLARSAVIPVLIPSIRIVASPSVEDADRGRVDVACWQVVVEKIYCILNTVKYTFHGE